MSFPNWFTSLTEQTHKVTAQTLGWQQVPESAEREAAVLILFGPQANQGDVVIIERPQHMRDHAGQPAFPGGRIEKFDASPVEAALREAREEIDLDPDSVEVVAQLPQLWIPPTRFKVTPVLAWWHSPHKLAIIDRQEVGAIHRIAVDQLVDPDNRVRVQTRSGYLGDAFTIDHMTIWGFTGGVLSKLLDIAGWAQPWDRSRVINLPQVANDEPEELAL